MSDRLDFIFDLPYLSCHHLEPDELHVIHLGTSQYMLGAVLYILCFQVMSGTPEQNLHGLWADITQYYRDYRVQTQYSSLTICSFYEAGDYSKLKGKGAEINDLMAPLAHVWSKHTTGSTERYYKHVSATLKHQCNLQMMLHKHKDLVFLPEPVARTFSDEIDGVLLRWSLVANASDKKGENIWNTPTKLHYLWHLGQNAMLLNHRKGNTMVEETYMGVCKTLAKSCLNSTNDLLMPKAFMENCYWALHFIYWYGDKYKPS